MADEPRARVLPFPGTDRGGSAVPIGPPPSLSQALRRLETMHRAAVLAGCGDPAAALAELAKLDGGDAPA